MFYISNIFFTRPEQCATPLRERVYATLERLGVQYERVETDPAVTMDLCQEIDKALGTRIVKTLLLTNRQQTTFYLLAMPDDKPFVTKDFSQAMGVARVSFAKEELLEELLGTKRGAATLLSAIQDEQGRVQVVMDKALLESDWFACSDGLSTGYMKLRLSDLLEKYLPHAKHEPKIIEL